MEEETITISREEYENLKKGQETDKELLTDIATGIKDVLQGNVEEI